MNNPIHEQSLSGGSSRLPFGFLASTRGTLLLISLVLLLGYGFALRNSLDLVIDGKTFYLSGKAMIVGGDPYDSKWEKELSERYAPDGKNAHLFIHNLIPPPITPLVFALPSMLPWSIFRVLLLGLNVCSIPLIAYFILRLRDTVPSPAALWAVSGFIAILPPTWQNLKLGQLALLILLCSLLAVHAFALKRFKWATLWTLLALLKPTVCLPLFGYLFVIGNWRARVSLIIAGIAYATLNLLAIARIQMQGIAFFESYRRSLRESFGASGINNPQRMGEIRLDAEVLLTKFTLFSPQLAKYLLALLLVGLLWLAIRPCLRHENQKQFGWATTITLLLALVLFYHRSYDAVLLLPALLLAIADWWEYRQVPGASALRWLYAALVVAVLLCLAAIGSSDSNALNKILSPLGMVQPFWFKAVCVLTCTVIATAILRVHSKGKTA